MKKNRKWLRVTALVLAMACLVSAVFAATFDETLDLSGDKKLNVWDIQLAVNDGKTEDAQKILTGVLGNPDELNPNADNVYEIYTTLGLYNMAKLSEEGASFKLMADIDLGGADWTPVDFYGNFDGNLHTISNFKITKSTSNKNMGFFGTIDYNKVSATECTQSVVENLKLENVEITAAENALYIGLLSGSNRGVIRNCTTVGTIIDNRTTLPAAAYVGTIVGRNNDSNPDGVVESGTNLLTATAGTANANDSVTGLTSKMAMNFAELSYPEGTEAEKQYKRTVGIAGYSADENIDTGMTWQDITNSTDLAPEAIQIRRQKVVDYMYDMCTVEWSPTADQGTMVYYVYKSGKSLSKSTYYEDGNASKTARLIGIPYNHGSSGLERFNAWVNNPELPTEGYYFTDSGVVHALNNNTPDADGYVTVKEENYLDADGNVSVPTVNYVGKQLKVPANWKDGTTGTIVAGFASYIGNDCSSAAAWAWRQVCAVTGTDATNLQSTSVMIPCNDYVNNAGTTKRGYIYTYGIRPVNGLTFDHPYMDMDGDGKADNDLTGDNKVNNSDYADMVEAVFAADNQAYWNAMAGTSKGDALVGYNDDGGHTRVAAGDAVVIRDHEGKILPKVSYIVTHEQGRGSNGTDSKGAWKSSCTVNCLYTFDQLTNYAGYSGIGSRCCYFPITNKALREVDTPAATAWCKITDGKVTSNFHIVSTTVGEEVIYTNTTLTGSRSRCTEVTPASVHTNKTGTVTVLLSNGQTFTFDY